MSARFTDPEKVMDIIRSVSADIIEPRFQALKKSDIDTKTGPSDLVTIADIEAEKELEKQLTALLPGSIAYGEEAISRGEKSLEELETKDGTFWVIDPVDGTYNFSNNIPKFGTMVALVHNGETVQSWIYHIPQQSILIAEQGSGTTFNGNEIKFETQDNALKDMHGFVSTRFSPPEIKREVKKSRERLGTMDAHFCCAHEYTEIMAGNAYYALYTRTKPWDHLPGALIISEAGGHVGKWDKTPYNVRDGKRGLLAAASQALWDEVHTTLLKKYVEETLHTRHPERM